MTAGVLAFGLLVPVAIASLPSVSAEMSWSEWRFVQGTLGGSALTVALVHIILYASCYETCDNCAGWFQFGSLPARLPAPSWMATLLPLATVALRALLRLPGIPRRLDKIRNA